ncbi:MAG: beta-lactamase family protein [Chloroflexi bacterium]|nr:beta-lactamase family protein [Chloroflexota bacterium]
MEVHSPETVGMSCERLERITPLMTDFVKDNRLPGILTLVQRRGKIVHLGKFGLMDIEAGKPVQEDGLYRIYSMTKPIISVALMTLVEEGRLSLNDPLSTFVPAFANTKVYAGSGALGMKLVDQQSPITLYHLLTHMAGLSYGWYFDSPVEDLYRQAIPGPFRREQPLQEVVERLAELPLFFQPGTQWRYSYATDILGHVLQVAADMPLADFLEKRIFRPLGMIDTAFTVPAEKTDRLAQIYASPELYSPRPADPQTLYLIGDVTTPTQCPSGGAGLVSTLGDYHKFCNCLLRNGLYEGSRLLSGKTLAWMTANHIPEALMPIKLSAKSRSISALGWASAWRPIWAKRAH